MDNKSEYSFKFSIIMALYNVEDYLKEAIDSIINQTIGFKENVQLILVDDGSFDRSFEIAESYQNKYPDNILAIKKDNGGQASARNLGLNYAKGKYLNFLDSDDYISKNTLEDVYKFFEANFNQIDVLAIPMILFERVDGPHRLNYKFEKGNRIIDLLNDPNNPILSSSSSFIKAESFNDFKFDESLVNLEDALIINKILLEKKKYGVINSCNYYYRQRNIKNSTVDSVNRKKEYFTDRLVKFYKNIIDYSISLCGEVPLFIQYLMAYDLQWLLKMPNLKVFDTDEEIKEFWSYLYFVLGHIDKSVILGNKNIEEDSKSFFIFLLNNDNSIDFEEVSSSDFLGENNSNVLEDVFNYKNKEFTQIDENNNLVKKTGDYVIDTLNVHRIWLDVVEIKNNCLNISGMFISNFDDDNYSIKVVKVLKNFDYNGNNDENNENDIVHDSNQQSEFIAKKGNQEFICKKVNYNTPERKKRRFLEHDWKYIYNFDVSIPLIPGEVSDLEFIIDYDDGESSKSFEALLGLNHNLSLSEFSAYYSKDSYILLYKNLRLHILNHSYLAMLRYEYSNIKRALKIKQKYYASSILIKIVYYIIYPYMINKRIWLFSDRPYFADDNAKHLFRYSINQNDNIKKYFVVNEDSPSFNEMKSISKRGLYKNSVIPFGSLKHKILYLFAEKAISSFTNEDFVNPFFANDNRDLYAGLFTCERLFLQHGVTKDDISKFVKKYNNNLSLIVTVSDLEKRSFLNEGYNYEDSIIQVLGFPRFDNLSNEMTKKQILFMPTWRMFNGKESFLKSKYYKNLKQFLNDGELFSLLREKGFKLIFKPHAEMMEFLDSFDINENVYLSLDKSYKELSEEKNIKNKIIFNDSYQDLFNESSILITDFSSVFFDFAYLKKPVIYYQTDSDYHYDDGYFDYESMGFGEIIDDEIDLIDKIKYYLENGCIMEDKFKDNVDKFFKFNDKGNCERVYKWILEH